MGKHDRCCVGSCDNDMRYQEKYIIHSNVKTGKLVFHKFPADEKKRKLWKAQVLRGRKDWTPGKFAYVCSNHFVDGAPTKENPVPTLFMSGPADAKTPTKMRKPPAKRKLACEESYRHRQHLTLINMILIHSPKFQMFPLLSKQLPVLYPCSLKTLHVNLMYVSLLVLKALKCFLLFLNM